MNNMSKIERQVMAGVGVIYVARTLMSATALKLYVLALSFSGIVALVSISNVANNVTLVAQGGIGSVIGYLIAAILGTTLVVQLALAVGIAAFVSLLAPVARVVGAGRLFA